MRPGCERWYRRSDAAPFARCPQWSRKCRIRMAGLRPARLCYVALVRRYTRRAGTLRDEGRVVFRYTTKDGRLEDSANPNGSVNAIAGVCNEQRNVVGLMPHPERASEAELGSADGRRLFESLIRSLVAA